MKDSTCSSGRFIRAKTVIASSLSGLSLVGILLVVIARASDSRLTILRERLD